MKRDPSYEEECLDDGGCVILMRCPCGPGGMYETNEVKLSNLEQAADDTAAAAAGVGVGQPYINSATGAFTIRLV